MRVIAGELRGRKLRAPEGRDTRPTSDRVRESLFNLLGPLPEGAHVLDLFAGSGALGIEALSRGAARATFVERGRSALAALRRNLAELGLEERADVVTGDALRELPGLRGSFDRIFADPPYTEDVGDALLRSAVGRLAPDGVLSLEHGRRTPSPEPPEGLALWKSRRYGDTVLSLYAHHPEESA